MKQDREQEISSDKFSSLPLATVVMVTYNSAQYVSQAIESVLAQNYENLELLICDDCSTDNTWDIVRSYKDSRIRAIRNPSNQGEYPNRNQAARLARGKYLIYLDGDDFLYPHGLQFMVRMLEAFPDSAIAMARPWSEKFIYPVELTPRQVYLWDYLGEGAIAINFAHILFRTSVLLDVGGIDERYKTGDAWIQLRIAREHRCLLISDGLAWWRRTPGQASEKLLRDHAAWPEYYKYRTEFLMDACCPLPPDEVQKCLEKIWSTSSRLLLRYILKCKIARVRMMVKKSAMPKYAWKFLFHRNFENELVRIADSRNPMMSPAEKNPFSRLVS